MLISDWSSDVCSSDLWYKRAWVLISGTAVVISAVLLNAPQMLQNARIIPKEVRETATQYQSWVKEDSEWTGHWSASPEGLADIADMQLSTVDMQITIWASQGEIDGTIAKKEICKAIRSEEQTSELQS